MNPTKIEWLHWPDGKPGYSWNPIQGLCPQDCWYCYARRIYKRFKRPKKLSFDPDYKFYPKKPSRIFVCSTMEIFHPQVKPEWRDWIFYEIKKHTKHIFFILTKRPELIDRPMPENVWLGTTITEDLEMDTRLIPLKAAEAKSKFISFEPLLGKIILPARSWVILFDSRFGVGYTFSGIGWIIIGRVTGHGKEHDPKIWWISDIAKMAKETRIPVFMKENLAPIWPGKLIQEFPK